MRRGALALVAVVGLLGTLMAPAAFAHQTGREWYVLGEDDVEHPDGEGAETQGGDPDISIEGGGWGHGVGMSQYGAYGLAREGKTAAEITAYYYEGSSVAALADLVPDSPLLTVEDAMWVGLPSMQHKTSFGFRAIGGPIDLCHSSDGEGPCPKQSATPLDGEDWSFEVVEPGVCQFFLDGVATGTDGGCRASLTWGDGVRVKIGSREYARGQIKVRPVPGSDKFHVSLAVGLDDYMYGLAEIPNQWPAHALRTQALAGRSYAAYKFLLREDPAARTEADAGLSSSRKATCWCHIYATTIDQNYVGYQHEESSDWNRWRASVNATLGQVISHPSSAYTRRAWSRRSTRRRPAVPRKTARTSGWRPFPICGPSRTRGARIRSTRSGIGTPTTPRRRSPISLEWTRSNRSRSPRRTSRGARRPSWSPA